MVGLGISRLASACFLFFFPYLFLTSQFIVRNVEVDGQDNSSKITCILVLTWRKRRE